MVSSGARTVTVPTRTPVLETETAQFAEHYEHLVANIETLIRGKPDVVRLALACLLAEGHILIEDVPGVGKTTLAKSIAESIDGTWQRIQFTPDLLPTDVTGVQIYNRARNEFEFRPGGVFANVVLADEINRASPKTQSALLEVMAEQQVTVDATTYPVPDPFIVIATQNPIEQEGTYNLPEAQIDRFMMRLRIGYPDKVAEMEIIGNALAGISRSHLRPVVSAQQIGWMIDLVQRVFVSPGIRQYVVALVRATRDLGDLRLGVSPRGSVALTRAAQAVAAAQGRPYVTADDIKLLAEPVLAHRMLVSAEADLQGVKAESLLHRVVESIPVPKRRDEE
jgi:MoxR-like ATPase